ncbi:MAG: phosphoglycolate phosphatase [Novosphingobium sp.]|nr:phosphoglycolate phosphatase [Novosphingobium sp.]
MTHFPFDIVGFDLDGTLLDTHGDLAEAVNHALVSVGRPPIAHAEVRNLVGGGSGRMLKRALEVTGGAVDDEAFALLHRRLLDYYSRHLAVHSCLFPGAQAMLDALAGRGVTLAVVTNKFERFARALLEQLDLASRFAVILGGDSLGPGRGKPAPDMLQEMVARCGGGRAVYVGDTTYDTLAARAAGIACVAVSFGFNDVPVRDLGAAAVIDHYDELIPVLERLAVDAETEAGRADR